MLDVCQVDGRHGEGDEDRLDLRDCHQLLRCGGDEIAGLYRDATGAPVHRGANDRVAQLHFGVVVGGPGRLDLGFGALHIRLVGFDDALGRIGGGSDLLGGVLRNQTAGHQLALPLRGHLLIFGVGHITIELRLRLVEERLMARHSRRTA